MSSEALPAGPPRAPAPQLLVAPAGRAHIVQFYEDDAFVAEVVAQYAAAGLQRGEPVLAVMTGAHQQELLRRLGEEGVDVAAAAAQGRLVLREARQTLARILVGGVPDWAAVQAVVGGALADCGAAGRDGRVRAYGEMVDLLWSDGRGEAAVQLEAMWNALGRSHAFSLLCTYDMRKFDREAHAAPLGRVCDLHSHVLPTERWAQLDDAEAQLREVAALQQRARALETEIAQRKETERALRRALQLRDEFLAVAGHELRTPLTAVQLMMESVVGQSAEPLLARRLRSAADGVLRLSRLVDELLDAARMREGTPALTRAEVDLAAIVGGVLGRMRGRIDEARCTVRFFAEPAVGCWDRARLEQVVANLVENALAFGRGEPVEVQVQADPARARLLVRDQGIGIAAADQRRIFRRFQRAARAPNHWGLGLGLWAARQIVVAHGGTIDVQSELGKGATFVVTLPYAPAA